MGWFFVYTREAHPGEHVGHHKTFADKLGNATLLRDEVGIRRPIVVDDLAGTAHRAYGLLPNMTWVVGRGGRILYKADWTSARNVEAFLERHEQGRRRRPASGAVAAYVTEQIEYRDVDREAFYDRLRRNGPRSYDEFKRAEALWRGWEAAEADREDPR
ncbi:MAG: hypothetical protein H0X67_19985 [Acidobacteria bacterium]|nr:hypothetical protein [Acidobacteriota bacterium]